MEPNRSFPASPYPWLSGATSASNLSFNLCPIDDADYDLYDDHHDHQQRQLDNVAEPQPLLRGDEEEEVEEREPMFEKSLTPSDVGKLNRLVIPKQHAEKHFPLGSHGGDKGLLLNFEDESGKPWRFRYSYWNSSQSYVLTKGWSRYVKEKRLDAGDVVLFDKHRQDTTRLFIGWKRRAVTAQDSGAAAAVAWNSSSSSARGAFYSAHPYPSHQVPQPYHQHQTDYFLHAGIVLFFRVFTLESSSPCFTILILRPLHRVINTPS